MCVKVDLIYFPTLKNKSLRKGYSASLQLNVRCMSHKSCANMNKPLTCPETKRLFILQNIQKFNQTQEKIDITPILNEHNLDCVFELLVNTYSKVFDVNFPVVSCTKNETNHQPWY